MPVRKAIARPIGVRAAAEECVRKPCKIDEQRLERRDGARPHAAAGRSIQRVSTKILDGRETENVDRRLSDNQSRKKRTVQRQSEERLYAPRQRAFVSGASDINVRNGAGVIEMGEPGAANGTLARTPATDAASIIAADNPRCRLRYRHVGEFSQTVFRSAQRLATALSGSFRPPAYRPTKDMAIVQQTLADAYGHGRS